MDKFESTITEANNHPISIIDNREIVIGYGYGEVNSLETTVEIDISLVDWKNIDKFDSSCELEVICICEKQRWIEELGKIDPKDPNSLTRTFTFLRDSETTPFFLVNVFKPKQKIYVANSHRIAGQQQVSDEEGLFNWEPIVGNYAWDVGFISDIGPTIFINQEKLSLMQEWLLNDRLLWKSLMIPTCLRQSLTLYFQHRNDSGGENEPWVQKYEIFVKELGFDLDETLFTNDIDMEPEQRQKAQEITDRYCELSGTITNIKSIMSKEVGG